MKRVFGFTLIMFLGLCVTMAQTVDFEYGMGCLPETDVASIPKQAQLMERDFKELPSSFSLLKYSTALTS